MQDWSTRSLVGGSQRVDSVRQSPACAAFEDLSPALSSLAVTILPPSVAYALPILTARAGVPSLPPGTRPRFSFAPCLIQIPIL